MEYRKLPQLDREASRLVLGTSGKRFVAGEDVEDIMEAALEIGINCVDTAREDGKSEEAIGRWLKKSGKRDQIVLISKCCHPHFAFLQRVNEKAAEEDLKKSLEALGTDHIDLYLFHRDQESVPVEKIVEFMNRFLEEGKIRAYGGSNWSAKRIAAANAYAEKNGLVGFTATSPHYSLGRQKRDPWGNGCKSITGDQMKAERAYYLQTQMPIFCWSSLCNGVFSGKLASTDKGQIMKMFGFNTFWGYDCPDNYERLARCEELAKKKDTTVSAITLAWVLGSELNTFPIVSASSPRRLKENGKVLELKLTEEERTWLNLGEKE